MKIDLSIELGNDTMRTPSDVAAALDAVSEKLARRGEQFYDGEGGVLMDENGNSVGSWHFTA